MNLVFSADAWDDYTHWLTTDKSVTKKINALIEDIRRHPFEGLGKPEPLKAGLQGFWSRRITIMHRLVYRIYGTGKAQVIEIAGCRQHY